MSYAVWGRHDTIACAHVTSVSRSGFCHIGVKPLITDDGDQLLNMLPAYPECVITHPGFGIHVLAGKCFAEFKQLADGRQVVVIHRGDV